MTRTAPESDPSTVISDLSVHNITEFIAPDPTSSTGPPRSRGRPVGTKRSRNSLSNLTKRPAAECRMRCTEPQGRQQVAAAECDAPNLRAGPTHNYAEPRAQLLVRVSKLVREFSM